MKKRTKNVTIIGLCAILGASLLGLTACGTSDYAVKVLLQDGSPAVGTQVILKKGNETFTETVNANGMAEFNVSKANYTVCLSNLPAGYTADEYALKKSELTITLDAPTLSDFADGNGAQFPTPNVAGTGRYETPYGTYSVTITSATQELFFNLDPDSTGTFAVFTTGNVDTTLKGYADYYREPDKDNDDRSSDNKNCYYQFELDERYYSEQIRETIGIMAKSNSYPVTFQLTFTKLSDYFTPPTVYERVDVETKETLSQYPEETTGLDLVEAPYDSTIVYNPTDRFYHIGSADGPVLVVKLTSKPDRLFEDASFRTANDELPAMYYLTFTKDNGTLYYKDYNTLIDEVYPEYVNSDGVYGVTEELKEFLYYYIVKQNNDVNVDADVPKEQRWLAPCYYYGYQAGTAENPYVIDERGRLSLITPVGGGTIHYLLKLQGSYDLYSVGEGQQEAKILYKDASGNDVSQGSGEGFKITVNVGAGGFPFCLTSYNNRMAMYDVIIVEEGQKLPVEEGGEEEISSYDNPIVLTDTGTVTGKIPLTANDAANWYGRAFYAYTAKTTGKLTLELKTNSVYTIIYNETQNEYTHVFTATPLAEELHLPNGYLVNLLTTLDVNEGDVLHFTFRRMVEKTNANNDQGSGKEELVIPTESKDLEFTLTLVGENQEADGTATNPYIISDLKSYTFTLAAKDLGLGTYYGFAWFAFTPTTSGTYVFTKGTDHTKLDIYTSPSSASSADALDYNDGVETDSVEVALTAGTTYYIYIAWNSLETASNPNFTSGEVTFTVSKK